MGIPRYGDLALLGRGPAGVVYRAVDLRSGRPVAVKVLDPPVDVEPARRLAVATAPLQALGGHPHVVALLDAGITDDGRPFLAMPLYDGSVQDRLDAAGSFPATEAVAVAAAVADAVQAAHAAGIVHGRIAPSNVLLSAVLGPALTDFGPAGEPSRGHTAPEALGGRWPGPPADVWSLGSLLHTMLAGRPPFAGPADEDPADHRARLTREPAPYIPRGDLPAGLREAVARALAARPSDRWATAAELRAALLAGAGGPAAGVPSWPPGGTGPGGTAAGPAGGVDGDTTVARREIERAAPLLPAGARQARRGRRRALVVTTVLAVALVAVGAVAVLRTRDSDGGRGPDERATTTAPDPGAAVAPVDFVAEDHGETVDLRWTDRSGGTLAYVVLAFRDRVEEPAEQTVPVDAGVTAVSVHGLDPDAPYCFRLVGAGTGPDGERLRTAVDQQVRGCTVPGPAASTDPTAPLSGPPGP